MKYAPTVGLAGRPHFGQTSPPLELGDYMDEVNAEVNAFDVFVRTMEADKRPADHCPQAFFGAWNQYVNAMEVGRYSGNQPYGWRKFFSENRSTIWRVLTDPAGIQMHTEQFEDELIRFYDWALSCGAKPTTDRPVRAHQPKPPAETTAGQLKTALTYGAIIAGLFAVGYVLQGAKGVVRR